VKPLASVDWCPSFENIASQKQISAPEFSI